MATGRLDNTNKGWDETDKYINDPDTEVVPEAPADHDVYGIGKEARSLAGLGDVVDQVAIILPLTPSQDQKDALDANPTLNAGNAVASLDDLAAQAAAAQTSYTWRTDTGNPANGEAKMNNADETLATIIRVANINKNGTNFSNTILKLGNSDALLLADNNDGTKVFNFDVIGDPTQVGGAGSGGYVEIPVAHFSSGTGGLIADTETVNTVAWFDGSNTKFLAKASNLSDLQSASTARNNLDVYSKSETYTQAEVDTNVGVVQTDIDNHEADTLNPHSVTASQAGAKPNFTENTGFNKNFGSIAGTVAQGSDSRFHSNANDPTSDQADALDNAPTALTAANPVASVADLPAALSVYDSGSFSVALNTLYTKAHGLSSDALVVTVYYRETGSDKWTAVLQPHNVDASNIWGCVFSVDSTNIRIQTMPNRVNPYRSNLVSGSSAEAETTGFYRVIAIKAA